MFTPEEYVKNLLESYEKNKRMMELENPGTTEEERAVWFVAKRMEKQGTQVFIEDTITDKNGRLKKVQIPTVIGVRRVCEELYHYENLANLWSVRYYDEEDYAKKLLFFIITLIVLLFISISYHSDTGLNLIKGIFTVYNAIFLCVGVILGTAFCGRKAEKKIEDCAFFL